MVIVLRIKIPDRHFYCLLQQNSNVVELYHLLLKDKTQLTYYNSGIGTYVRDSHGLRSWFSFDAWRQWGSHTIDMMIAWYTFSLCFGV